MVKDFLKKTTFHTDYFYMILTYGNRHGGAAELAQKFCQECRLRRFCVLLPGMQPKESRGLGIILKMSKKDASCVLKNKRTSCIITDKMSL